MNVFVFVCECLIGCMTYVYVCVNVCLCDC